MFNDLFNHRDNARNSECIQSLSIEDSTCILSELREVKGKSMYVSIESHTGNSKSIADFIHEKISEYPDIKIYGLSKLVALSKAELKKMEDLNTK